MKKSKRPRSYKDFPKTLVKQMLSLSTSGFGLVAALAWNEVITEFVKTNIKPYFASNSSLISLTIYAVIVTTLAVLVTFNLSLLSERLANKK